MKKFKPIKLLQLPAYLYQQLRISLDKNYVNKKIEKRIGKCKKCGRCCKGCWYLDKKTKLCKVYPNRPTFVCYREFPLTQFDQKVWALEKKCNYKFKN